MISSPSPSPRPLRVAADSAPPDAAADPVTDQLAALSVRIDHLLAAGLPHLFARVESLLIAAALARSRGNQVGASARLGISRNSLRTLVRRHHLEVVRVPRRRHGDQRLAQAPVGEHQKASRLQPARS